MDTVYPYVCCDVGNGVGTAVGIQAGAICASGSNAYPLGTAYVIYCVGASAGSAHAAGNALQGNVAAHIANGVCTTRHIHGSSSGSCNVYVASHTGNGVGAPGAALHSGIATYGDIAFGDAANRVSATRKGPHARIGGTRCNGYPLGAIHIGNGVAAIFLGAHAFPHVWL